MERVTNRFLRLEVVAFSGGRPLWAPGCDHERDTGFCDLTKVRKLSILVYVSSALARFTIDDGPEHVVVNGDHDNITAKTRP